MTWFKLLCVLSGIVTLLNEYTVCTQGQTLTPEMARILVSYRQGTS